jgi:hypothetical protein
MGLTTHLYDSRVQLIDNIFHLFLDGLPIDFFFATPHCVYFRAWIDDGAWLITPQRHKVSKLFMWSL